MFVQLIRWLVTMAIQQGARRFVAHVWDDFVDMMMSVWKWMCEKVEKVCRLVGRY